MQSLELDVSRVLGPALRKARLAQEECRSPSVAIHGPSGLLDGIQSHWNGHHATHSATLARPSSAGQTELGRRSPSGPPICERLRGERRRRLPSGHATPTPIAFRSRSLRPSRPADPRRLRLSQTSAACRVGRSASPTRPPSLRCPPGPKPRPRRSRVFRDSVAALPEMISGAEPGAVPPAASPRAPRRASPAARDSDGHRKPGLRCLSPKSRVPLSTSRCSGSSWTGVSENQEARVLPWKWTGDALPNGVTHQLRVGRSWRVVPCHHSLLRGACPRLARLRRPDSSRGGKIWRAMVA